MAKLIDLMQEPVRTLLPVLLRDKTTGRNIIWATDSYADLGSGFSDKEQIDCGTLLRHTDLVRPRVEKSKEDQAARTRKKAEVFTPTWLCNEMNNFCDEDWFGRKDVFNTEQSDHTWLVTEDAVQFPAKKPWKQYIDSRRLEITCGEAPFLVSRYDASTGDIIVPPKRRIGLLDRKLRIVNENAKSPDEWVTWAFRAVESCYGYEYQGDNLLLARVNVLLTFLDYYQERMEKDPDTALLRKLAGRIAWNLWQMDGLKDTVPLGRLYEPYHQMSLFDLFPDKDKTDEKEEPEAVSCRIYDWRRENSLVFQSAKEYTEMGKKKLFTYVLGNPPYQEDVKNQGDRANPVYDKFMAATNNVASVVELIHPARFLFNAGQTPKKWNQQMLADPHFKVLSYEPKSGNVFPGTDIKGGVAVTIHDSGKTIGPVGTFTAFPDLNGILGKVRERNETSFAELVSSQGTYRFSDGAMNDHPEIRQAAGSGTGMKIVSKELEALPSIFLSEKPNGGASYIKMLGRLGSKRVYRYIRRDYVQDNPYLAHWKVLVPEANGTGALGEVLSTPLIGAPLIGACDTFLSIGPFDTESEADACLAYIKTKFSRACLGAKKVTQHNPKSTWECVPMQDFTSTSDIDWSQSILEIDRQLYRKYGLTADEIDFIETHVKEMV